MDPEDESEAVPPVGFDVETLLSAGFDDDVFRALANEHRRVVLYYLLEQPRPPVGELVDVLAGVTGTRDSTVVTPEDREEVESELRHRHLPVLEEAGLVDYDRTAGTVSATELPPAVREFLEWTADQE